jgi:hypothetical protein
LPSLCTSGQLRESWAYLIDVCDPNGDMIDNLEISKATAMRVLEVIDLGPLREHARLFNAALLSAR